MRSLPRSFARPAAVVLAATVLACGDAERPAAADTAATAPAHLEAADGAAGGGPAARAVTAQSLAFPAVGAAAPAAPPAPKRLDEGRGVDVLSRATSGAAAEDAIAEDAAPMIVRSGSAALQVDSLDLGVARLREVVRAIPGAYVANMTMDGGRAQTPRATLEVKVPAAGFDRLIAGLAPIGKVEAVNVTAADVTEEFVDLTARAENARRLEARLVDLLARRTGKLEEVLSVERELARVREEVERHEGRLRYLRTRAATSTLAVSVHEPLPVLGDHPTANPIAEAFRQSWRNLVGLVAGAIALSGVVLPLALLGYVAWRLVRRFHRATAAV